MLTKDLVRITVRKGIAKPRYLDPESALIIERVQRILAVITDHVGQRRGDLDEALKAETDSGRDFRVWRGVAKLVLDKAEFELGTRLSPPEVRALAFELATANHPLTPEARAEVLAEVARRQSATSEEVEAALFADLKSNERMLKVPKLDASWLIHRYNVALAQAAVQRSSALTIHLEQPSAKRLRRLVSALKFHRLIFAAERSQRDWRLVVDGPVSVVKRSKRYGFQLAHFLPSLLLMSGGWRLEADYEARRGAPKARFLLDPSVGLKSHLRDTGMWVADEERALAARLSELASPLIVSTEAALVDLDGRDALVPDLTFTDPETGAVVHVEVIWTWRRGALKGRAKRLEDTLPGDLVLAVCGAQEVPPTLQIPVHVFKGIPNARAILKLCRELMA